MRRITLCLAAVAIAALTVAAAPQTCDEANPWPYQNKNYLTPGGTLQAGQALESKTAKLQLSTEGQLSLIRKKDGFTAWTATQASGCQGSTLTFTSTALTLTSSAGSTCWSQSIRPSEIAVVTDHCGFETFEKAPLTNNTWQAANPMCIEVHIVPHSHDDVGWLLTPERYYDGCRSPGGGVRGILDTVTASLARNPNRTFNQVESYFFNRWWNEKNDTVRNQVRDLVAKGQLAFLNGGWSMHDEACVHQESAISNMEVGARFLKEQLGVELNIGWHIDPFGHASATPRYMAEMGFDAFFFWRTDYEHKNYMLQKKTVESLWRNSPSLGDKTLMFTSVMYDSYCYGCHDHTCISNFYSYDCEYDDQPFRATVAQVLEQHLQDSRRKSTPAMMNRKLGVKADANGQYSSHIASIAKSYAQSIRSYEEGFRHGHVLMPWGCDFGHEQAEEDYQLIEQVMGYLNDNYDTYGLHLFFSTAPRYVKDVHAMNYQWPQNEHDYFLDSDNGHAYWSGYLSSRAEFKGYERILMNERSSIDAALSAVPPSAIRKTGLVNALGNVEVLREALGVAQHHDSITGTERTAVRNQYQWMLNQGHDNASSVLRDIVAAETGGVQTEPCKLSNLSYCPATNSLSNGSNVSAYVYNSLAQPRTEIITVPIPINGIRAFAMPGEVPLTTQTVDTWALTTTTDNTSPPVSKHQPYQAYIQVDLPALSFVEVVLVPAPSTAATATQVKLGSGQSDITIANEAYSLTFNGTTGRLSLVTNLETSVTSTVNQNIGHYCPHPRSWGQQAAGAYIMRTCEPDSPLVPYATVIPTVSMVQGSLCSEVRQMINSESNIQQAFRLCGGQKFVEMQSGVGEVNTLGTGVEVVVQLQTDVPSNKTWYTDSQALEMQERVRDSRPNYPYTLTEPVASNFFPCNAFAFLNSSADATRNVAVMADRSRATSSLADGELEFVVQRRLIYDDNRGVGEPLDEITRVLTTSRVVFNSATMYADMRTNSLLMTHKPLVRFGAPSKTGAALPHFSFPAHTPLLPANVHLHTRTVHQPGQMLVRLQHLYAAGEGSLAVPVTFSLASVVPPGMSVYRVTDMDMNGVKVAAEMNRLDFQTCTPAGTIATVPRVPIGGEAPVVQSPVLFNVTLQPMEIRVLQMSFTWSG